MSREFPRTCEGCGCTDANPCLDPATGEPCAWVPREEYDGNLCTRCARIAVAMASAGEDDDAGDADDGAYWAARKDEPLVTLATEGDANRMIAELRAGGGSR